MAENFYTRRTPDYSPLVAHFTKGSPFARQDLIEDSHPLSPFKKASAQARLISILQSKTIIASPMPHLPNNPVAVCFTECIFKALVKHIEQYSSYGIVFSKKLIYDNGGGPALYIRGDSLSQLGKTIPTAIEPFISPFDPFAVMTRSIRLDYVHEREWRLPKSLDFQYSDIEFVIVASIQDATQVVRQIGAQYLPEEKCITMDVYNAIEKTWRS